MKILITLFLFLASNAAAFDVGGSLPQGLGDGRYVQKAGDTMSGPLTLAGSSLTVTGATGGYGLLVSSNVNLAGIVQTNNGAFTTSGNLGVGSNNMPRSLASFGSILASSGTAPTHQLNPTGGSIWNFAANSTGSGIYQEGAGYNLWRLRIENNGAITTASTVTVTGSAFSVGGSTLSVSGGFTVHNVQNKATINAMNAIVGGVVTCSDCTNTYTLCVGTGTAKGAFREVGTATNCN